MLLNETFTQNYPNDNVCRKINSSRIKIGSIISIESHRYRPEDEFPLLVTVWYRDEGAERGKD